MSLTKTIETIKTEIGKRQEKISKRLDVKEISNNEFEIWFLSPDGLAGACKKYTTDTAENAVKDVQTFL